MALLKAREMVCERWRVMSRIGGGGFGQIYKAYDIKRNQEIAIKVETANENRQVLPMEVAVLQSIKHSKHVPKFFGCGTEKGYNYVVMELLSRNIADLKRNSPYSRFSQGTSFYLAMQALNALRDLHSFTQPGTGFLHRDVKPSNFTLGLEKSRTRTLYVIDFGLCRRHMKNKKEPRPPRPTCGFRGTVRYASVNSHEGREVGRHDDLISLLYMLVEMNQGTLPWRRQNNREEVLGQKKTTTMEILCLGSPPETLKLGKSIKALNYYSTPNYNAMEKILLKGMEKVGFDPKKSRLDWEANFAPVKEEEERGIKRVVSEPQTPIVDTFAKNF